jgi:hypothetical protein
VRSLKRAGMPRSIAMKITGHKTEAVYRRCAIVNEADTAEGFQTLEQGPVRPIPGYSTRFPEGTHALEPTVRVPHRLGRDCSHCR